MRPIPCVYLFLSSHFVPLVNLNVAATTSAGEETIMRLDRPPFAVPTLIAMRWLSRRMLAARKLERAVQRVGKV
jgi:hypothetical protein